MAAAVAAAAVLAAEAEHPPRDQYVNDKLILAGDTRHTLYFSPSPEQQTSA